MELSILAIVVVIILLIIAKIIQSLSVKSDGDEEEVIKEEKKIVQKQILSGDQVVIAVFTVAAGIIFNIYSMPIIIILAIILKLSKQENDFTIAYYKGFKILMIVYLIILIAFGLCMAALSRSSFGN